MLWLMPQVKEFSSRRAPSSYVLDMCAYSGVHKKPTLFLASSPFLNGFARLCPGVAPNHPHEPLKGTVFLNGQTIFRTKLAQVYSDELCEAYVQAALAIVETGFTSPLCSDVPQSDPLLCAEAAQPLPEARPCASLQDPLALGTSNQGGLQFSSRFSLTVPPAERKRPVGQPCRFREHRQTGSARVAIGSGYQMRRGLVPPIFETELEPGQAVQHALRAIHPFTQEIALETVLTENIRQVCTAPADVLLHRSAALWLTGRVLL